MQFEKVRLPRRSKRHPLVVGLTAVMKRDGCSMRFLARNHFKLSQAAVFAWWQEAQVDRDFNLPPRSVIAVCRLTGQPPYLYNPKLWPNPEWRV